MKRYRTIVADPPWEYPPDPRGWPASPSSRAANPRGNGKLRQTKFPYKGMRLDEIKALPVCGLADDSAVLFLWATNRHLPAAFGVMRAWGFDYRQLIVWHKTGNPSPFGGSIAPIHAEYLLFGRRGKPEIGERWPSSVIAAPAPNCYAHSAKPDCILDRIEATCPSPYAELFARRARFGWDVWGDESIQTAELPSPNARAALTAGDMAPKG